MKDGNDGLGENNKHAFPNPVYICANTADIEHKITNTPAVAMKDLGFKFCRR